MLQGADLVLAIGMDVFEELFYWGDVILNPMTKLIHVDPIPGRVGKSEPTDVGIVSHCGLAIEELIASIKASLSSNERRDIGGRAKDIMRQATARRRRFDEAVAGNWNKVPMIPERMMSELAQALPKNAMVVDDSVSHKYALRRYISATQRGDIRGVRGQSIGGGIGATMGTQCANPDRPVFSVIGDGSAMMTIQIQGLWTAANDHIPCIFVICNNGMYRVLKVNFGIYEREILKETEPAEYDLPYSDFPLPFDLASIATSMGVHGERIADPGEIRPAVELAIAAGEPTLLGIVIDGSL